jgi:hypothetical protein
VVSLPVASNRFRVYLYCGPKNQRIGLAGDGTYPDVPTRQLLRAEIKPFLWFSPTDCRQG